MEIYMIKDPKIQILFATEFKTKDFTCTFYKERLMAFPYSFYGEQ